MIRIHLDGLSHPTTELLQLNSKYFTTKLRGGIGNQLFQYFAGLYFAIDRNISVRFNVSGVDHGTSIQSLGLPGVFVSEGFAHKLSKKLYSGKYLMPKKNLVAVNKIGFDGRLEYLPTKSDIEGYFQTNFYIEEVRKKGINFAIDSSQVAKPVEDYGNFMRKNSVLIHIRRGDYLNGRLTLGNLSELFFRSALEEFPNRESVHILSDANHDEISDFLSSWGFSFSLVPKFLDIPDFEYLYLFKKASYIIGSNSSYSWWGAQLASQSTKVIFPKPWFKADELNAQFGERFYSDSWQTKSSMWI